MVLHLLSKKSWNVYAPDNIARVKRDQADLQAREEEDDRRLQEHDSERRLAILRGERPADSAERDDHTVDERRPREDRHRGERRKRRRLHGEDDTDRDLRLAQEDLRSRHEPREDDSRRTKQRKIVDAPIIDHNGNINLFPIDHKASVRAHKNAEVEAEKARKQRELEDQYTMRFSNAAGRDGLRNGPWYASKDKHEREDMTFVEGKDVWGRPDPSAKDREQTRQNANDPFAFMQKAQSQLKQAEKDRERWRREEQSTTVLTSSHHRRHRRDKSKERSARSRGERRYSEEPGREGHTRSRERRREHDHNERYSTKPHSTKRKDREAASEIPDDFRLDA